MLIYVAGPYTGKTKTERDEHIAAARKVAEDLWGEGHAVICPHTNSGFFDDSRPEIGYSAYAEGYLDMVARVDALVMMPNWKDSPGATNEHEYAVELGVPIFTAPQYPMYHITEKRCPIQSKAMREVLGRMYRTYLAKNADYSPANILGTGTIGLMTRLWDKTARLMNLHGFKLELVGPAEFTEPTKPKNESIEDTFMDLSVYGIIGLLLRHGKWGK